MCLVVFLQRCLIGIFDLAGAYRINQHILDSSALETEMLQGSHQP